MPRGKKADQKKDTTQTPETQEQVKDTTPAQETPEPVEGTAPAETPEPVEGTAPAETPEPVEGTAPAETPEQTGDTTAAKETQERDLFEGIRNPCVYCGPTVRGVARQYTTYQGGIPDTLRNFIKEHPEARQLIVSTAQFPAMRKRLDTPGTAEAKLYKRVKEQL